MVPQADRQADTQRMRDTERRKPAATATATARLSIIDNYKHDPESVHISRVQLVEIKSCWSTVASVVVK